MSYLFTFIAGMFASLLIAILYKLLENWLWNKGEEVDADIEELFLKVRTAQFENLIKEKKENG